MNTVLGLDLGTQGVKGVFYDFDNRRVVSVVQSPLSVNRDSRGKAEQDAHAWLTALGNCMQQAGTEIRNSVRAISVSGQQHGFVALDARGKVLAPVKLWCDTSTQYEAQRLAQACGGQDQAIALTGNPVLTGYTAPKILWLRNNHPETYSQMQHILLPHDYLNFVLTGEYAMEFGDASGTGLLDVRHRQWSQAMLSALDPDRDLSGCLPPLYEEDAVTGVVTQQAAARYGLPAGIPVATGGGDNMMGAIGTGNVSDGELTISLGSSGTLYASSSTPVIDPHGEIAAFCSSTGGWLPLLCTMNCTLATELIRSPLNISLDEFDSVAGKAPAGSGGLLVLPFFHGERTPDLPSARAVIFGMDERNTKQSHILRATLEATTFGLKSGLDTLSRLGIQGRQITLTGGGSKSPLWRQVVADVFNLPVTVLRHEEGAAFGAALQALWILQNKSSSAAVGIADICKDHLVHDTRRSTVPDPETVELYVETFSRYRRLLAHMTPVLDGGL